MKIEHLSIAQQIMYTHLTQSQQDGDLAAIKRILFTIYSNFPEHRNSLRELIENFFPTYLEILDKITLLS